MRDKKVLTIQDVSCYGQCSLTVALPIISACGIETAILPSAVLSTHTGGFTGYTFRDLTNDIPDIAKHWQKENIKFDTIYTGYLGSKEQIAYVKDIMDTLLTEDGVRVVDPAMADHGKLYYGFDEDFVKEMASLCSVADVILPNITEACFMTNTEFKEHGEYDEEYILDLLGKLGDMGCKTVVLTGVTYTGENLGVAVYECATKKIEYYFHQRISRNSHGTGDVYSSSFCGAFTRGFDVLESAKIAADFTVDSILQTIDDNDHWYGVKFEKSIPLLISMLNK